MRAWRPDARRASLCSGGRKPAVYEPAGLPFLDAASARGDYGLFRALPPERRIYLDYDEKDDWMFYNVNTPADLEAARRARLP